MLDEVREPLRRFLVSPVKTFAAGSEFNKLLYSGIHHIIGDKICHGQQGVAVDPIYQ